MANQMTDEEIAQLVKEHKEAGESMDMNLEHAAKLLGRNNSVIIKMMKINDIFKSFTKEELMDLEQTDDYEQDESEGSPVQEES